MKITNGVGTCLHTLLCLVFILVVERRTAAVSATVGAAAFVAGAGAYLDNLDTDER